MTGTDVDDASDDDFGGESSTDGAPETGESLAWVRVVVVPVVALVIVTTLGGFFRRELLHQLGDRIPNPALIYALLGGAPLACALAYVGLRYVPRYYRRFRRTVFVAAVLALAPSCAMTPVSVTGNQIQESALQVMSEYQNQAVRAAFSTTFVTWLALIVVGVGYVLLESRWRWHDLAASAVIPIVAAAGFFLGYRGVHQESDHILDSVEATLRDNPGSVLGNGVGVHSLRQAGCRSVPELTAQVSKCRGVLQASLQQPGGASNDFTLVEFPATADAQIALPTVQAALPAGQFAIVIKHVVFVLDRDTDAQVAKGLGRAIASPQAPLPR